MTISEFPTNSEIADIFERVADLLEAQDADPFRIRAYRQASKTIRSADVSIAELAKASEDKKLEELPNIGSSIASSIREFVHTGRLFMLNRLEGQLSPEALFTTVPGIGEELAQRIHRELQIDTLEELEVAANDGRLEKVFGLGDRRVRGIRDTLATMLSRSTRRRARGFGLAKTLENKESYRVNQPPVGILLDVDEEYRMKAEKDQLKKIAPRRFNPTGESWLPILHTDRGGWHFTVLYSNTARAHDLRKTKDWVVLFYERNGDENQCTIVTEHKGDLRGRRVVRGREPECRKFYRQKMTKL